MFPKVTHMTFFRKYIEVFQTSDNINLPRCTQFGAIYKDSF